MCVCHCAPREEKAPPINSCPLRDLLLAEAGEACGFGAEGSEFVAGSLGRGVCVISLVNVCMLCSINIH